MNIKTLQEFVEEFKDIDIDEDKKIKLLNMYNLIITIKTMLDTDIKMLNQNIVYVQRCIDKYFNTMLESIEGTEEYRKAKVKHDIKTYEKNIYYGHLKAAEKLLKLIHDKEEADRLEMDYNHYLYCQEVGADEDPF